MTMAGQRQGRAIGTAWWGVIFAAPAILYIVVFQLYPILFSFFISLHDYDLLSPPRFVGLKNFAGLASDKAFLNSLTVTILYVAYTVIPVLGLAFLVAWALTALDRSRSVWRSLIFVPSVLPIVSVALVWKLLFSFQGPFNGTLAEIGLAPVPWLNSSTFAPWALVMVVQLVWISVRRSSGIGIRRRPRKTGPGPGADHPSRRSDPGALPLRPPRGRVPSKCAGLATCAVRICVVERGSPLEGLVAVLIRL